MYFVLGNCVCQWFRGNNQGTTWTDGSNKRWFVDNSSLLQLFSLHPRNSSGARCIFRFNQHKHCGTPHITLTVSLKQWKVIIFLKVKKNFLDESRGIGEFEKQSRLQSSVSGDNRSFYAWRCGFTSIAIQVFG